MNYSEQMTIRGPFINKAINITIISKSINIFYFSAPCPVLEFDDSTSINWIYEDLENSILRNWMGIIHKFL